MSLMDMHHKMTVTPVDARESGGKLIVTGWASVPVIDRSNEFIDGRAYDLTEYQKNPVFLWCHDRKSLPLGRATPIARQYDGEQWGLYAEFEFDPNYDFATKVYQSYRGGYMRGFSVGFAPTGREYANVTNEFGTRNKVLNFTGAKLYEISAVPIPDNAASLAVPVVKELISHMPNGYREKMLSLVPNRKTFYGIKLPASVQNQLKFPVVEKQVNPEDQVMNQTDVPLETTADATMGAVKPGPQAFRHVVENCMKAISDGMGMVANSDHPAAADKMYSAMQKILKGLKGACSTAGGMWPEEGFDQMETKINDLFGSEDESEDELPDELEDGDVDDLMDEDAEEMEVESEDDDEEMKGYEGGLLDVTMFASEIAAEVEKSNQAIRDMDSQFSKLLEEQQKQFELKMKTLEAQLVAKVAEVEKAGEQLADAMAMLQGVQI